MPNTTVIKGSKSTGSKSTGSKVTVSKESKSPNSKKSKSTGSKSLSKKESKKSKIELTDEEEITDDEEVPDETCEETINYLKCRIQAEELNNKFLNLKRVEAVNKNIFSMRQNKTVKKCFHHLLEKTDDGDKNWIMVVIFNAPWPGESMYTVICIDKSIGISLHKTMKKYCYPHPSAEIIAGINYNPDVFDVWNEIKKRLCDNIDRKHFDFNLKEGYTEEKLIQDLELIRDGME